MIRSGLNFGVVCMVAVKAKGGNDTNFGWNETSSNISGELVTEGGACSGNDGGTVDFGYEVISVAFLTKIEKCSNIEYYEEMPRNFELQMCQNRMD